MYKSIKPGQVWLDTNGKRIQAHGGSIFYENGVYYWYGENKEFTDGESKIWHYGVRCYSSPDLYNWTDLGLIIPPEENDICSSLHPYSLMDRPHILYCPQTKKYVCWCKIMHAENENWVQNVTILTADNLLGPYTKVKEGVRPLGMSAGDFTLVQGEDGKGYYIFERVHSEMIIADMTDDYMDLTGVYSTHFPQIGPPYVREAPAHFVHSGRHYLITSGTTGYYPNPSEVAVSDTLHGPYRVLGSPHKNDSSNTSFHSQISCVFKVQGKKDLYIAMADRWLPGCPFAYEGYKDMYERLYTRGEKARNEDQKYFTYKQNTSLADYVWLPVRFDGEKPVIQWKDEWKIEDFD